MNDDLLKTLLECDFETAQELSNSDEFIEWLDSIEERSDLLKNVVIHLLEIERNEEGYYLDAFDKIISYNGIKTLKKENTKVKWSKLALHEYKKCSSDYNYFFFNYCKIMTKRGYNFPELREYQLEAMEAMLMQNRLLLSYSRQMGKCTHKGTFIDIMNNETKVKERITVEEFNNRVKNEK